MILMHATSYESANSLILNNKFKTIKDDYRNFLYNASDEIYFTVLENLLWEEHSENILKNNNHLYESTVNVEHIKRITDRLNQHYGIFRNIMSHENNDKISVLYYWMNEEALAEYDICIDTKEDSKGELSIDIKDLNLMLEDKQFKLLAREDIKISLIFQYAYFWHNLKAINPEYLNKSKILILNKEGGCYNKQLEEEKAYRDIIEGLEFIYPDSLDILPNKRTMTYYKNFDLMKYFDINTNTSIKRLEHLKIPKEQLDILQSYSFMKTIVYAYDEGILPIIENSIIKELEKPIICGFGGSEID